MFLRIQVNGLGMSLDTILASVGGHDGPQLENDMRLDNGSFHNGALLVNADEILQATGEE